MYSIAMDFSVPPPPSYALGDGPCYRCSKPRITTVYDFPHWYPRYDCPVNHYCPNVVDCDEFSREPGVD